MGKESLVIALIAMFQLSLIIYELQCLRRETKALTATVKAVWNLYQVTK